MVGIERDGTSHSIISSLMGSLSPAGTPQIKTGLEIRRADAPDTIETGGLIRVNVSGHCSAPLALNNRRRGTATGQHLLSGTDTRRAADVGAGPRRPLACSHGLTFLQRLRLLRAN